MKYDSDDALDQALFALPLEEPPSDLRAAILTATVYRPAPVFKPWEIVTMATIAAVAVWLAALVIMGGAPLFMHSMQAIGIGISRTVANVRTVAWLAAGAGTAIWLTLFMGFQPLAKGVVARRR